jgi:transposase InsO family protein
MALRAAEDWRIEYNTHRPHGSLDFLTPEAYRQQWTHQQSATPPTLS